MYEFVGRELHNAVLSELNSERCGRKCDNVSGYANAGFFESFFTLRKKKVVRRERQRETERVRVRERERVKGNGRGRWGERERDGRRECGHTISIVDGRN